jgi:hypothetical protein
MDIRVQLHIELANRFYGDLIRSEMGLCLGETRVDVAVVNGHLHGYEIKSERDTLSRLPTQVLLYDRVLDYSTIVCGQRHLKHVLNLVPARWGVIEAVNTSEGLALKTVRAAKINRSLDRLAIAQLLWRDEAAAILVARGETIRRRDTRWDLWDRLALLPLKTLQLHVRRTLKERRDWPGG